MEPASADLLKLATAPMSDPSPAPAALLVFAHPDDETIALGARIGRLGNAVLAHVTDGALPTAVNQFESGYENIESYRNRRQAELEHMLTLAGVPQMRRLSLQIPAQEASLQLTAIARWVVECIADHRPEVVFTHPYEGGHPDHDACAFAVHTAAAILRCRGERTPLIIEAPFYHASLHGVVTDSFLPAQQELAEIVYQLSPEEQQRKQQLLDCFETQREALGAFRATTERYRTAPAYEFRRTPHAGSTYYDDRSWGMSSTGFTRLAWEAEDALAEEMRVTCL